MYIEFIRKQYKVEIMYFGPMRKQFSRFGVEKAEFIAKLYLIVYKNIQNVYKNNNTKIWNQFFAFFIISENLFSCCSTLHCIYRANMFQFLGNGLPRLLFKCGHPTLNFLYCPSIQYLLIITQ